MTQRISDIEASRRRLRIVIANRAIALGWALKGSCKPCAHRLFTTARWLAPEAQRFLIHYTGSHNRNRRTFEPAVDSGTLLGRIQPLGVVAGFVIVLVLLGSLDLALQTTATGTRPLAENSAFRHEQIPSESKILSVSKSSEGLDLETGSISGAQIVPVPLPLKKPEISKILNGKGTKANPATQKRMAQQKRVQPKPAR